MKLLISINVLDIKDLLSMGRPNHRKMTQEEGTFIAQQHLKNPLQSVVQTASQTDLSRHTIRRRLQEKGLKARKLVFRPFLTDIDERNRLA